VQSWLSLLAIKDMTWEKGATDRSACVVPVGEGIVRWAEVGRAVKERKFNCSTAPSACMASTRPATWRSGANWLGRSWRC
jgi:hypothetical protein